MCNIAKAVAIVVGIGFLAALLWPGPQSCPVFSEAEALREAGQYRQAIAKYELSLARDNDADFSVLIGYRIATCYVYWADGQNNALLYGKAEEIVEEIYPTATIPKHREGILHIWGYLLLKQARHEEACLKFQEFVRDFPESILVERIWYLLGRTYLELGNEGAARQAFQQLLDEFPGTEYKDRPEVQRLLNQ